MGDQLISTRDERYGEEYGLGHYERDGRTFSGA
jgi:hypothetical protein